MKKMLVMLLCGMMLLNMIACQTTHPNEGSIWETTDTQTEKNTEKESEVTVVVNQTEEATEKETEADTIQSETEETKIPETDGNETTDECYSGFVMYHEVEEFLRGEWERQCAKSEDDDLNSPSSQFSVVVPILKRSDYELVYIDIQVGQDYIDYAFAPINRAVGDYDPYIGVRLFMQGDFHVIEERAQVNGYLQPEDGFIYSWSYGDWYVDIEDDIDGNYLSVSFPASMRVRNEYGDEYIPHELIDEFFDFEYMTYSPSAETHAVQ